MEVAEEGRESAELATRFLRWSFARGVCGRGYWLVASVYLVVVAHLSPSELVLIGTFQALVVLIAEVPAGVFADTVSRKWSLVLGHGITAAGIVMTGFVTRFPELVVSQALWGLGWAFVSGADVAWITDELDQPSRIDRVLAARARWELLGAATGLVVVGALAAVTPLATAIVTSGIAFAVVGAWAALRFAERRFRPSAVERRWRAARATLRAGGRLARRDREIFLVIVAWLLVNGSGEGYGRLFEKRLITIGFGARGHVIAWFTVLGLVTLLVGAVQLRIVEANIHRGSAARQTYLAGCMAGVVGMVAFAAAPNAAVAVAAVLLASPAAKPGSVLRATGEIWVNRRTAAEVRATVHSLLSQAENLGEFVFGLALAAMNGSGGLTACLIASAALLAGAAAVVSRTK